MAVNLAHDLNEKERTKDVLVSAIYNFDSLLLSKTVSQGLQEAGFYKPSPIQLKAIPLGRCGLDLIVKAKSGTGKTAVFAIIALEMIDVSISALQAVILSPTREIAVQIKDVIETIGKHIKGLHVASFIGGLAIKDDIAKTKECHIAVGAPGRLKHLVEMGNLKLSSVRLFIMDEADKLMGNSFQNDINYIYYKLPENKQIIAISATYPDELDKFLERYMQSPTFVTPTNENAILLGLKQFVAIVESKPNVVQQLNVKNEELLYILSQLPFTQCLIFSNYQQRTESISNILNEKGWKTKYISAAQSQTDRLKVIESLKTFQCRIFLSTDLTARGIDSSNVDLVINYDVPNEAATYLHRMGRAGRYGSKGICITITNDGIELGQFQNILGEIGGGYFKIPKLPTEKSFLIDIWNCDVNSLEQICGIIDVNKVVSNKNYHVKKVNTGNLMRLSVTEIDQSENLEVLQTKNQKARKNSKGKKRTKKEISNQQITKTATTDTGHFIDKSNFDVDSVLKDLAAAKTVIIADHKDDYSEFDSKSLLHSLAAGNIPKLKCENKINEQNDEEKCTILESSKDEITNPIPLYPLTPIKEPVLSKCHDKENLLQDYDDFDRAFKTVKIEDHKEISQINYKDDYSEFDSKSLLRSLAAGNIPKLKCENKINKQNDEEKCTILESSEDKIINPASLYPWIPVEEPVLLKCHNKENLLEDYDDFDRASSTSDENSENIKINETLASSSENLIVYKNVALFNISKLLSNDDLNVDEYDVNSISNYLNVLHDTKHKVDNKMEKRFVKVTNEDLLTNVLQTNNKGTSNKDNEHADLNEEEDIFKIAYNFVVKNDTDWRTALGDKYVPEHENDMEVENEVAHLLTQPHKQTGYTNNFNETANSNVFDSYFDYYNRVLARDAITFEDVPSFNNWFDQWQWHVQSVRDYVQQNIYMQEMNNYNNRSTNSDYYPSGNY